jgi:hypothetical protein
MMLYLMEDDLLNAELDHEVDDFESHLATKDDIVLDFDKKREKTAKIFLDKFFANECLHTGGPIPRQMLHNERRLKQVVNLSIMEALDLAYDALGHVGPVAGSRECDVTDDIRLVISVIHKLAEARVPQEFSGGMLCVYLELVEGIEF